MAKYRPNEVYTTEMPDAAVSFDLDAFDNAIRSQGVTFVHYRAMRCPVGMIDEHDSRRPHEDHSGCSNGFYYTKAGEFTALFSGNSMQSSMTEVGAMDGSTVNITAPPKYDGSEESVFLAPFDRLFLSEDAVVVPDWQLVRHDPAGVDKLNFQVVQVQDLVDAKGKRYEPGDYEIRGGKLYWSGTRPGVDPQTGRGLIYACRYLYRPYWYVKQIVHEVRVAQAENPYTGVRQVNRMPQACVLQREYVFEKNERDQQAPDQDRQVKLPDPGPRFGPR